MIGTSKKSRFGRWIFSEESGFSTHSLIVFGNNLTFMTSGIVPVCMEYLNPLGLLAVYYKNIREIKVACSFTDTNGCNVNRMQKLRGIM
jgi:hypothetical protein